MIIKPPYTSPISFDSIGPFSCLTDTSGLEGFWGSGMLAINGLGQIAGNNVEWVNGTADDGSVSETQTSASVFVDDVENGAPGASDQVSVFATTQGSDEYLVAGINNNGQIAGTYISDGWYSDPDWAFFINTDGSIDSFAIPGAGLGFVSGINDDVQMAGGYWTDATYSDWAGLTVDTQH